MHSCSMTILPVAMQKHRCLRIRTFLLQSLNLLQLQGHPDLLPPAHASPACSGSCGLTAGCPGRPGGTSAGAVIIQQAALTHRYALLCNCTQWQCCHLMRLHATCSRHKGLVCRLTLYVAYSRCIGTLAGKSASHSMAIQLGVVNSTDTPPIQLPWLLGTTFVT